MSSLMSLPRAGIRIGRGRDPPAILPAPRRRRSATSLPRSVRAGYKGRPRPPNLAFGANRMEQTTVIVGAGQAASQIVDSLRREGLRGRLVVVGDEPYLPYQRPPLSKKYLAGEMERDRLFIRPEGFYQQNRAELKLGVRATTIDRAAQTLALDDGTSLRYDHLVLATGSRVRKIAVPGSELKGIHYLRGIDDVDGIRAAATAGKRMVVIGAGYIGLETAATCVKHGVEVTVLEMADRPLVRVVAPEMSAFYLAEHARAGVRILCNTGLASFEGEHHVSAVVASDGQRFPADIVVVGIGILPNQELAQAAGIVCDNGIAVDEHCRTSDPKVYAIGDCCSLPSPHYGRRVRLESVDNAFEQARSAAANLCGKSIVHDKLPWFWSDQYDLKLQIVGLSQGYDRVVLRGDPATRSFSCCYLKGNELLAVDAVSCPRDFMGARKTITEKSRIDLAKLADPAIAIKDAV
jgi:3-phenylpropionate/trans-cinnamate dioxygenase ferredoxin reductase component